MRVKELIEHLQTMPSDLSVLVDGYEQDLDEATYCVTIQTKRLIASWYEGDHRQVQTDGELCAYIGTGRGLVEGQS